jgi:hypothetical protein
MGLKLPIPLRPPMRKSSRLRNLRLLELRHDLGISSVLYGYHVIWLMAQMTCTSYAF